MFTVVFNYFYGFKIENCLRKFKMIYADIGKELKQLFLLRKMACIWR